MTRKLFLGIFDLKGGGLNSVYIFIHHNTMYMKIHFTY